MARAGPLVEGRVCLTVPEIAYDDMCRHFARGRQRRMLGGRDPKIASQATRTIPIVSATLFDPIEAGLAASLAHPGGNVTGLTLFAEELSAKRLQLLQEAIP